MKFVSICMYWDCIVIDEVMFIMIGKNMLVENLLILLSCFDLINLIILCIIEIFFIKLNC